MLRMTQQREIILEELKKFNGHPSADELFVEADGSAPGCEAENEVGRDGSTGAVVRPSSLIEVPTMIGVSAVLESVGVTVTPSSLQVLSSASV